MNNRPPPIQIETLSVSDGLPVAEYSTFLRSDPSRLVYSSVEFLHFLERATRGAAYVLLARRSVIVGALPLVQKRSPKRGLVVNSLPWYGSHGGCLLADPEDSLTRAALLERWRKMVSAPDVLASTVILTPSEEGQRKDYHDIVDPDAIDHRLGQVTPLPEQGEDVDFRLERTFRQKTRNTVRKSRKQGFREEVATDHEDAWRFLHASHVANMTAIGGTPKPWDNFVALRETLPRDWLRLSLAMDGNEPVAALLLIKYHRTIEYITPTIQVEHRSRQPLSFLIWHAMREAIDEGLLWWNWGGTWTSQDSLRHFKAGWGAVDRPYSYLTRAKNELVTELGRSRQALMDDFRYFFLYPLSRVAD